MDPEEAALEHREIDNVAGFLVEFERVDDGESSKRQDFDFECENGGRRDWYEARPLDGHGSVETLAHNWTPLDREVQHEFSDSHHGPSTLLGWACGLNGLFRDLQRCRVANKATEGLIRVFVRGWRKRSVWKDTR